MMGQGVTPTGQQGTAWTVGLVMTCMPRVLGSRRDITPCIMQKGHALVKLSPWKSFGHWDGFLISD
jgi:hypothetical protein